MGAIDTSSLHAAQSGLLDAAAGDFLAPVHDDTWPAEIVLAHVIATERTFTALGAELLLGRDVAYDNQVAISRPYLDAIADARRDLEALRAELRRGGAELVAVADRVGAAVATTSFPCRIHDGETLVLDGAMSFADLLQGHARDHLPLHLRQLDTLRREASQPGGDEADLRRTVALQVKYVVFYEVAEGGMARVPENYPAHQARNLEFQSRGLLLMTGPFAVPGEGAMAIFTSRPAAEEFIQGDPFVLNGVVGRWDIREWNEGLVNS
jgi:uncharacterized protein